MFEEGDFAEVVGPHAEEVAGAGVAVVAVAVGEDGGFVEGSGDVGGEEPFAAAAGGGERGVGFDVGDPTTVFGVAIKEPGGLFIEGGEGYGAAGAGEGGGDLVLGEGGLEIGGGVGAD